MLELGYLIGKGKKISFIEEPTEKWVIGTVNYLVNQNKKVRKR